MGKKILAIVSEPVSAAPGGGGGAVHPPGRGADRARGGRRPWGPGAVRPAGQTFPRRARIVRTFHHAEFGVERLARERELTVSACLPTREEAATIGGIVDALVELRDRGGIDQVVVIDAASADGTAAIAAEHGAEVFDENTLLPGIGRV